MVIRFFRGDGGADRLERIETLLQRMLADDRHSFDVATGALFGGASAEMVGSDLRSTDRRVNETEVEVRRELIVHISVSGSVDIPTALVYMSVVKDIERIGDYAKNIFDLADDGADLSAANDRDSLIADRDRVSAMISETAETFRERDTDRARALIAEGDELQNRYDDVVSAWVRSDAPAHEAVPRALYHRHLKRIVAHLMNVLSAVVMPVDRLDYYDEDPADRL
jgi:phosphate uptake regulator